MDDESGKTVEMTEVEREPWNEVDAAKEEYVSK